MAIATRVKWFLDTRGISYELVHHDHSSSSLESAQAARLPGGKVVKCVLLEDERGYVAAIVPASYRVDLKKLERQTNRKLELASEAELADVFPDCEMGALPPLGHAYGIPTVYDDRLRKLSCVYFEGGDHRDLVYVGGREFIDLLRDSPHGDLCRVV